MSNGWGLNVMDMFYNTTPHIKARPAYKTRNRISAMTPPASFTAHLTMLASRTRGAITNYVLCQIPLARTCQRAYKVNVQMSHGRTAFRCHDFRKKKYSDFLRSRGTLKCFSRYPVVFQGKYHVETLNIVKLHGLFFGGTMTETTKSMREAPAPSLLSNYVLPRDNTLRIQIRNGESGR